jgi:hypothetical protein
MEVTHNVTDHAGTFGEVAIGPVATVIHCIKDTTVDRFEAISYVWQGTGNDYRHGVIKIGTLHFSLQVNRFNPAVATNHFNFYFNVV